MRQGRTAEPDHSIPFLHSEKVQARFSALCSHLPQKLPLENFFVRAAVTFCERNCYGRREGLPPCSSLSLPRLGSNLAHFPSAERLQIPVFPGELPFANFNWESGLTD